MDYNVIRKTIDKIVKALKKGNYDVYYEEPNNIEECMAPDGRIFYKVVDLDDAKSSNYFGSCSVEVEGYTFSCDFAYGETESDFFDEIEEHYVLDDGTCIEKEDLVEEVIESLSLRKDIYFGEYSDTDSQMDIYSTIHNLKNPEYYWCEAEECPIDIYNCDFTEPKQLEFGTVYFRRLKYYFVEEPNKLDSGKIHAVHCKAKPDDSGLFPTVLLEIKYDKHGKIRVTKCNECEDVYDAQYKEVQ